ncbi:MAG: hypothetical protein ACI4V1_08200 [Eubacteriales bacterium]
MENVQPKNEPKLPGFWPTVLAMLLLVLLGRGVSYFNTAAATDIAYAAWVSPALSYLAELLVCARMSLAIAGITCAVYRPEKRGSGAFLAAAAVLSFADYAARFLIDLVTDAIVGAEVLAVTWLLLQFLYEMLFLLLSYVIAGVCKKKHGAAEGKRQAQKYSAGRSCAWSLLLVMLSHLVLELWYFIDFITTYTDITSTEIASIIGSFLKIIVIYGGAALLLGEWYVDRAERLQ